MKIFKIAYHLLIYFVLSTSAYAANHYIRAGASGANNGSDWTNAWTTLPGTYVRGDTYYIADGTYTGSFTFSTENFGSTYIFIKKATVLAHGTSTGWSDSYGDGVALFTNKEAGGSTDAPGVWSVTTGYWDFDGVIGGGPGNWESGHGFKITPNIWRKGIFLNGSGASYINIRHIEITRQTLDPVQIYWQVALVHSESASNVLIQYCFLHTTYFKPVSFVNGTYWTIEYTKVGHNYSCTISTCGWEWHSEPFAATNMSNVTLRYNYIYKWRGSGMIFFTQGAGQVNVDWQIYGNLLDQEGEFSWIVFACFKNSTNEKNYARRWRIHNNTFVNLRNPSNSPSDPLAIAVFSVTGEGDNQMYNNIFWNTTGVPDFDGIEGLSLDGSSNIVVPMHNYNWWSGSNAFGESNGTAGGSDDPFVNSGAKDFRLSSGIVGNNLSAPYNYDMYGNLRDADGTWDRGAFGYNSGNSSLTLIVPMPPENLIIK